MPRCAETVPAPSSSAAGPRRAAMAARWLGATLLVLCPLAAFAQPIEVADAGFALPTSVVHDEIADVYLVANVDGVPMQKDGDGFVSRLAPDGEVLDPHWIHGGRNGVELHAPAGMAIEGDTLWIADVDEVRAFDRRSGAPLQSIPVPEATFLVDVAASPEGHVYVTNIDLDDIEASAIHRVLPGGGTELVARGAELDRPTALVATAEDELLVVTNSDEPRLLAVRGGVVEALREFPTPPLEGLVVLPGGDRVVSFWGPAPVLRFTDSDHDLVPLVEGSFAVGNIGYDERRHRLLAPKYRQDAVMFLDLEP